MRTCQVFAQTVTYTYTYDNAIIVNDGMIHCRYSSYVVALAYHVITIWFIRARIHYRRSLAKFIIKVSNNWNTVNVMVTLINAQHLSEEYAYTRQHEDGDGQSQKVSPGASNRASRLSPSELQREMVEVCLDMLARYTFASVSSQITR